MFHSPTEDEVNDQITMREIEVNNQPPCLPTVLYVFEMSRASLMKYESGECKSRAVNRLPKLYIQTTFDTFSLSLLPSVSSSSSAIKGLWKLEVLTQKVLTQKVLE